MMQRVLCGLCWWRILGVATLFIGAWTKLQAQRITQRLIINIQVQSKSKAQGLILKFFLKKIESATVKQ